MAQQDDNEKAFSQIGVAPVAAPPAAPAAQSAAVPGEADFAKLGVAPTTPPSTQSTDSLVGRSAAQAAEGVKQFAAPLVNVAESAINPPENGTEQVIAAVGGPGALLAYRQARGLVGAAKNIVEAGPESYVNAVTDFKRAHEEFKNHDYRNAASSVGSLAADVAGATDPTMAPAARDARELTEGARPGGNFITPAVRQGLTAGAALLGTKAVGAEGAVAEDAAPSTFRRLIVNPFRRAIAGPAAKGEQVASDAATVAAKEVAGGNSLRAITDVDTPMGQAKNLYQSVDKAAGSNFKDMYTKLDNLQQKALETADGSAEEAKALADVKTQEDAISDAKARAAASGVPDVDKMLAQADAKYTEASANKEFNFKFKKAVEGNKAVPGAPESVDVDKAIKIVQDMTEPTIKYPTPRAYQTTMGKAGTSNLLKNLYAAKSAGKNAVALRTIRNWAVGTAATVGGVGYEIMKP